MPASRARSTGSEGRLMLRTRCTSSTTRCTSTCSAPSSLTQKMHLIPTALHRASIHHLFGCVLTLSFDVSLCTRIVDHANRCAPLGSGRYPNFILMDFVDLGNGSAAADLLNGFGGA